MSKVCQSCGKELADTAQFCDNCGASFVNQQTGPQSAPPPPNQNAQYGQQPPPNQNAQYGQQPPNSGQTPPAEVFSPDDIEKNKTMAGLAYLIFFLPLIACPDSRFARFHANQGLLVFLLFVLSSIVSIIRIPFLSFLISLAAYIFALVLLIMGMINGFGGKAVELPLIGKIRIIN